MEVLCSETIFYFVHGFGVKNLLIKGILFVDYVMNTTTHDNPLSESGLYAVSLFTGTKVVRKTFVAAT